MNNSHEYVPRLSPEKRARLKKMLHDKGNIFRPQLTIPKRDAKETAHLSFAQQRLWFLNQLEPDSTAYNMRFAFKLLGELHVPALEQSIAEIQRRHEVLRTVFPTENEIPFQKILDTGPSCLFHEDYSYLSSGEREERVREYIKSEALQSFDLAAGPLIRVTLLHLKTKEYLLLLTMHHIISDGWSMGVLYRELSVLYNAFLQGDVSPLQDLPVQYADFAAWQRDWLQSGILDKQLTYWKKQLGGKIPRVKLPTDYLRPSKPTHQGNLCTLVLSQDLSASLTALSRQEGVTLFMTVLAVFKILLHRLTSLHDVTIGTPIANRGKQEIEGLIGFFVNTLVLRTDLSGNPTFQKLLVRIRDMTLDAFTHQDVPFEKLVEKLQPDRNLAHTPLFQVMLNMVNLENEPIELAGIKASVEPQADVESKFDLTLYVTPEDKRIRMDLVYNKALFKLSRIQEMLYQMKFLFEQVVETRDKPIGDLSLVTPEAAHILPNPEIVLAERKYPLVMDLMFEHAAQSPESPAISQGGKVWTYNQFASSVLALAQTLNGYGLKKKEVVAVTGPKSFGIIAAAAAVFLHGGTLLFIEQSLPGKRKGLMCKEAQAKYLLHIGSWDEHESWFKKLCPLRIISVGADSGIADREREKRKTPGTGLPEVTPDDTAYIVFTSGTTGIPKGVLCSHQGLSHFLLWQKDTFAVGAGDRCAQLTSFSFDVALRDIFLPLISGATLVLPDEAESPADTTVLQWLDKDKITLLHVVPSLARSWLDAVSPEITLQFLRIVFFAGEPLRESFLHKWKCTFPDSGKIVNLYGPTETTFVKCYYELPPGRLSGVQPVGRPLPDSQALTVSKSGQLCGIGEIGEVVLRTPFPLLGYLNSSYDSRPCFVDNPFGGASKDTVYFTGDLGRYRPDGILEILGRIDDQVKIRGVRIEPDEVTAVLESLDQIDSAFVMAGTKQQEEKILVAYIVPAKDSEIIISHLRSAIKEHLPDYMVPSLFVALESLPLTQNGKVNRQALPEPEQELIQLDSLFIEPQTHVERELASIWRDVLRLKRVGIEDDFFSLGGYSLLATRITAQILDRFNIRTPLRVIFEHPTISGLAAYIEHEIKRIQGKKGALDKSSLNDREEFLF